MCSPVQFCDAIVFNIGPGLSLPFSRRLPEGEELPAELLPGVFVLLTEVTAGDVHSFTLPQLIDVYDRKVFQSDVPLEWLTDDCQLHGFHWRAGAKRDTVGMWIWGEPIMIEAASGEMYAMDTQGTFDNTTTYQQCLTIFALSTIISCVQHECRLQIYNVVDNIQEDALQHLSLFVEYGRLAMTEAQQFGKPFQSLVFCVRDFKNPEEYGYGEEGGTKFLQQVLMTSPNQPEELRCVREQLSDCFEQISCYLLPHPGYRVAERQSFRGHVKDLRPVFREEMKKMVPSLLNPHALQPKIINGKPVTCRKLMHYFKEYVNSFDGNTMPEPHSILNANAKLLCIESANEAKVAYCRGMDRSTMGSRMMPEKRLLEAHIKHGITALNIFDKCPKIGTAEIRSRALAKLQEDINAELERYKRLNMAKKVTGCASAMTACGDSALLGVGLGAAASGTDLEIL
ncbi:guanylate-binding protein [Ancylostoma duodenale]|uniref:Guanylate-binding protein n=1 Tax=Ancylostoma duodenale TaxID=51022 RepID=A0A0C2CRK8_9BILA|nr:guanylate-binding protein [Ancylostoma duodenale]